MPPELPDLLPRARDEWADEGAAPRPWNNDKSDYEDMPVLAAADADTAIPTIPVIGEDSLPTVPIIPDIGEQNVPIAPAPWALLIPEIGEQNVPIVPVPGEDMRNIPTLPQPGGRTPPDPNVEKYGPRKFDPGGPTIVSDDKNDEDNTNTAPTPRRSKRLNKNHKKRTILSMVATALSVMGQNTVFSNTAW
jgi:hypothetical protein